VFALQECNSRH